MLRVKRKQSNIKGFNMTDEQRALWKQIQSEIKAAMSDELKQKSKEFNTLSIKILRDDHPNEEDVQRSEVLWEEIKQLRIPHKEAIKKIQIKYGLA